MAKALPILLISFVALLQRTACPAGEAEAPKSFGWRGNWTGLFPDAEPPVEWARIAKGVVAGMSCEAAKPADGAPKSGQPVTGGLIRDWLVIGLFPVTHSVKDFDQEQIAGEAALAPAEGEKVGELAWTRFELKKKPDYELWGTTELDWVDLAKAFPFKPDVVAYAHTYLYCERAGTVNLVVDHSHGLKVWVNGQVAYSNRERGMGLGNYVGLSRYKQGLSHGRSPKFPLALQQGWNRLLLKLSSGPPHGWRVLQFAGRLIDPEPVPYDEKNIVWMTRLPERTNACPVIVGDRIFTPAEPDELLCLDKATGKILWRRFHSLYDATPEADRAANPIFKEKIEPLADELAKTMDYEKGLELRRKMGELLVSVDKKRYTLKWDGHLASHFGIVGFTTTPVSDGKHVYAFFGHGVVACYDLDGTRKWIRRLESKEIVYSCSPAITGGRLVCVFEGMHALDAETGAEAWFLPKAGSIASLIPIRVDGTDAVSTRGGWMFRASDGKELWKNPPLKEGDGGWGAAAFLDRVFYVPWHGIGNLVVADFSQAKGDAWQPKTRWIEVNANHHRPNGEWLDRSSPASPLIYKGIYYGIDEYGVLYATDLQTGKTLYSRDTGFDELHHYNAIGVAASPALAGGHVYVMDNQGSCLVFEPGPVFKQAAMNRIETVIQRDWPIPPQETLANGPPVFDGQRVYIRGEQYLYCIGEK